MFMYIFAGIVSAVCHAGSVLDNRKLANKWYMSNISFKTGLVAVIAAAFVAHVAFWPLINLTEALISAST